MSELTLKIIDFSEIHYFSKKINFTFASLPFFMQNKKPFIFFALIYTEKCIKVIKTACVHLQHANNLYFVSNIRSKIIHFSHKMHVGILIFYIAKTTSDISEMTMFSKDFSSI